MASIITPTRRNLTFPSSQFPSLERLFFPLTRFPDSSLCRCSNANNSSYNNNNNNNNNNSNSINWIWESAIQDVIKNAIKRFDSFMNPLRKDSASPKDAFNNGVTDKQRRSFDEEFGVVTRYQGQGRLAEPGFRNP